MSRYKHSSNLKTDLSKLAKISNIQGGLPPIMRGLPVLVILAGEAISRATNTSNIAEKLMLGADETVLLAGPSKEVPPTTIEGGREWPRDGVKMMCARCGEGQTRPAAYTEIQRLPWTETLCGGFVGYDGLGRLGGEQSMDVMKFSDARLGRDLAPL